MREPSNTGRREDGKVGDEVGVNGLGLGTEAGFVVANSECGRIFGRYGTLSR